MKFVFMIIKKMSGFMASNSLSQVSEGNWYQPDLGSELEEKIRGKKE